MVDWLCCFYVCDKAEASWWKKVTNLMVDSRQRETEERSGDKLNPSKGNLLVTFLQLGPTS
jgi:hypothetical protein